MSQQANIREFFNKSKESKEIKLYIVLRGTRGKRGEPEKYF